jgi:hypothetical protein
MLFSGDRLDAAWQPYKTVNCDQFPGAYNFILKPNKVVAVKGSLRTISVLPNFLI